jgi:NADH-quinone oxidoreductase E subunit
MGNQAQAIVNEFGQDRSYLIPMLQKVQEAEGYISEEAVEAIGCRLGISANDVYSVASFYAQFRFQRPGKHTIKVCLGTACHVRGGERIAESVERELGIKPGETTEDFQFSVERVACFGACALAPVMVVDDDVYSRMTPVKVKEVLDKYRSC